MTAYDFPNSPSEGQIETINGITRQYSGGKWSIISTNIVGPAGSVGQDGKFVIGDSAPTFPANGESWFDSTNGKTYIYYDSYWVETGSVVIGPTGPSVTGPTGPSGASVTGPTGPTGSSGDSLSSFLLMGA